MTASALFLQLTILGWGVLCGAMIYEHVAVIPQWARRPPESLTMWTGEHRLRAERFWMSIHPLLVVLLGVTLATGWSDAALREPLLIVAGGYAVVIAATAAWYVPELMKLIRDPTAPIPPQRWRERARRWETLSLARGALILGLAWPLLGALREVG
ncbi:MAG: hypothetical protein IT385_09320 [Deltaproteobacteria bacterium]|nr:hypothetical protein [Deltaproteobacteria bacterium]